MTKPQQAGFTLIEVLVALAILSIAVVAAIQGFAQGLRLLKLSGDHQHAMLIADQKAREIVIPKAGQDQGEDQHDGRVFTWETITTEIIAPDLTADGTKTPTWRVFQIDVKVRWDNKREIEVTTLRTAAAAPEMGTAQATGTTPGVPTTPGTTPGTTRRTVTSPR